MGVLGTPLEQTTSITLDTLSSASTYYAENKNHVLASRSYVMPQVQHAWCGKSEATTQLRYIILDFKNQQSYGATAILKQHKDELDHVAKARQAKIPNIVKKGMPTMEEHNFMKWEFDTEVRKTTQSKDKPVCQMI